MTLAADVPSVSAAPSGGDWLGEVGSAGYALAAFDDGEDGSYEDRVNLPPAGVFFEQGRRWVWSTPPVDGRALEDPTGSYRRASSWFDGVQLRLRLEFSEDYSGPLSVYAVDWDSNQRSQTVAVEGPVGVVQQSTQVSSFDAGRWVTFDVSVSANTTLWVTATRHAGANAVISGLFLGPGGDLPHGEPQGDWIGAYGSDGYALGGLHLQDGKQDDYADHKVIPAAGLRGVLANRYTWATSTTDRRALQHPYGGARRVTGWWHGTEIRLELEFTQDYTGPLSIYSLDWDNGNRGQHLTVSGPAGSQSVTLNSFSGGAWSSFPVSVSAGTTVTIKATRLTGANAVINGVFLGGPGALARAPYRGAQGDWPVSYGADGSALGAWNSTSSDLVSLPAGVSLTLLDGGRYRWDPDTDDPAALVDPGSGPRRATGWYDGASLQLRLSFTDAYAGPLALYMVDWDSWARRQRITVDAPSGSSSFIYNALHEGGWHATDVSVPAGGQVTITADRLAGANAVISGLFLGDGVPGAVAAGPVSPDEKRGTNPSLPHLCDGQAGDPISTSTGNFHMPFVDFAVAGRGPGLVWSRSYNSLDAAATDGPLGFGWTHSYAMSLELAPDGTVTVHQENGSVVRFESGRDGYQAAPRVTASLQRNADGSWRFVRHAREVFRFDSTGRLVAIEDLNGDATTLTYNGGGQLTTVTDDAGRQLLVGWTNNKITSVTGPSDASTGPQQVTFAYSPAGDLTTATDVADGVWTFGYDNHRLTTMRKPRHAGGAPEVVVTNVYDALGRVESQTDENDATTTLDYTSIPGATKTTDPDGDVTVEYYTNGVCTARTYGYGTPEAATWTYERDPNTLGTTKVTGPDGAVTTHTYDQAGNRTSSTDPLGRTTSVVYNHRNQPVRTTTPLTVDNSVTVSTTLTYDAAGNLLSTSRPLLHNGQPVAASTSTYQYGDPAHPGDLTAMVDPRGQAWTYQHDTAGNLAATSDPLGNTTISTHNAAGWVTSTVSARGNAAGANPAEFTSTFTYNPRGQVTGTIDATGATASRIYDANGNLTTETDANNHTTSYAYDPADRLITVTRPDSTTVGTQYWPDGTLKTQTDPAGATTSYTYDALDRLVTTTDQAGRVTILGYDTAGNVQQRQDPGGDCGATPAVGCVTYDHDDAGQLTGVDYSDPNTPDVTNIVYDGAGRRTSRSDGTGISTWSWDSLGRLTSHSDGTGHTTGYGYDLAGNLTSIAYPDSVGTVSRGYDDAGRWMNVTDWGGNITSFGYDPDSNLTSTTYPTGTGNADTLGYDDTGRLTSSQLAHNASTVISLDYQRDLTGQLKTTTATGLLAASHTYDYDTLSQLTDVDTATYNYDPANNLTDLASGATQAFDTAHQLCWTSPTGATETCGGPPADATTYTYDGRGNRATISPAGTAATNYGYDQDNRLTTVTNSSGHPSAGTWTYQYDASGLRTAKVTPAGTATDYAWDHAAGLPLLLTETTGSTTTAYLYGPGGLPLADKTGTTQRWYHHDQLGSTIALSDVDGAVIGTYSYDPYGNPAGSTGTATTPFGYAGQYTDAETGSQYLRARYYDPATGQFLTRDPIEPITREPYQYASNDPVNNTDPTGLSNELGPGGWDPRYHDEVDCKAEDPSYGAAHRKGKRPSTKGRHERGEARKKADSGSEKGDARRRGNPNKRRDSKFSEDDGGWFDLDVPDWVPGGAAGGVIVGCIMFCIPTPLPII